MVGLISLGASTTLADLLTPLLDTNPFSTVRASFRWQLSDERDDGVADGRQAWLRRRSVDFFSPPRCFEAAVLQEGEGEHCHERMAVETLPGSPFEVIEAKFLFQLLMGLLANPSCLDGGRQGTQTGRCRQIGEMVFLFA